MAMDLYQEVIYKSRYARWVEETGRRENWDETIDRYVNFFKDRHENKEIPWHIIKSYIHDMRVMPSMRALMTAGKALDRDNVASFNCSYVTVDSPRAFDEAMYILMCGTGVGFSVERQYINKLPEIAEEFHDTDTVIVVKDSRIGWASSFREFLSLLWIGQIPKWDTSKVRPKGAPLKTFGGRASGPEPLEDLFRFCIQIFKNAAGRKLTSLECHDIMCKIAEVVVSGGVRRSACLSLSNLSDDRMRSAKSGQWWVDNPQRQLANNTAVYTEKPDIGIFMQEWHSLYESKSGERGIMNRKALQQQAIKSGRRDATREFGLNPCAEIILRGNQFCNLSEVIVRADDTLDTLKEKVKVATLIGTLQATLTDFRYLRKIWIDNTQEESLLGVSLTGIMDHPLMSNNRNKELLKRWLTELKEVAVAENKKYAEILGINPAAAITAIKPSGTVSQLVNSSSGIHPRFSKYYIRRVRMDKKDPISKVLIESGVPCEDDLLNDAVYVFSFPIKSPDSSIVVDDVSAIDQLEHWLTYRENWCEHNPSITTYLKESEWLEAGAWVYKNFDNIGGISFLPLSNHTYKQQPYEKINEVEYLDALNKMPKTIDWGILSTYEAEDMTNNAKELACSAGMCEL